MKNISIVQQYLHIHKIYIRLGFEALRLSDTVNRKSGRNASRRTNIPCPV